MPDLSTSKKLRAERARLAARMGEIQSQAEAANRSLNTEERGEFTRLHEEQNTLLQRITDAEQVEELRAEMAAGQGPRGVARNQEGADEPPSGEQVQATTEQREGAIKRAFNAYLRWGREGVSPEDRAIINQRFITPGQAPSTETRAQSVGVNTAGGYLVPQGFYGQIVEAMLPFGGMRESRAEVIATESGNAIPIPTDNDTSNTGVLIGENAQRTEAAVTFGQVVLNAYGYTSGIVLCSLELLQDSAFDLEAYLRRKFAQRIGRITNTHFTNGDGASKPYGVVPASTAGVSGATGQSTSVIPDNLSSLMHSVNRDYRVNGEWMLADSTLLALKQLKDGEGRPVWLSGLAIGAPDTILGKPYIVNDDVPAMAASAKSILFGDFSLYKIRDVTQMSVLRLNERYADLGQVGFLAFARHDGKLADAGTRPIKHYANSAS